MELGLRGKRVLVTGASKGIGRACADSFAAEGCDVILVSRDPATLSAAADAIRAQAQVNVQTMAADLSKGEDRIKVHAAYPDVDIVVNNAGAIPAGRLVDIPMERWMQAWDLKVFGYIHMCQMYLPVMEARGAGSIVNIIGMAGRAHKSGYIAGSAGNAALIAFTEALGSAAEAKGVQVVGINPSVTKTDRMLTQAKTNAKLRFGDENRWADTLTNLPFGRPIEASEIADLAVYLASDRGHYIAGTVVDVDGGGRLRG